MSITYNDLISRAEQVRDESEIGANTATRVGQLLADIIQWCQDNNADLGDYLLNFTAHLNESGGILNWFQSRIVLLKTMGGAYDDVSVGSLSDGDVYYDSQGNWIREKQGSTTINGIHPSKGVFYVNLANKTAYQWDGTTFQVAIESGGGGGAIDTEEEGFFVADESGNIGLKYDEGGFDVALLSQHFIALLNQAGIGSSYKSQCVVRFLPFLSAWDNASKNSLCLCSTKQQLVDNKVPFYDGFLFHKLPTDDKSLWYGTTLENAVQIGTVNFTPKNCLLAMSPTDGRVIAAVRGDRGDIHVWDGTTDHTVAAVTSDGNNRKAMGWLYNSGVDFIKDGNNVERCIFAEYDGSVQDKGGFYVWVGTYPYTSASDWKTTLHKPMQYYGTIQDGTITHFHQIRRDPWTNILYLTSGDQPGQLVWWYSTDYGDTWTELTNNKTNGWEEHVCRLINFCFTDEWIYWATDHGTNHCLNRIKRNAQTGVIDPSTREKLCDLPFAQACNSICLCESPKGIFMYERIDTGTEYEEYYGGTVKMLFWSIPEGRLYTVAELGLTNNSWGGSRGKCYLNYTNGQQPRPAMGFSDDSRCVFDLVGADNSNIGTIFYEL